MNSNIEDDIASLRSPQALKERKTDAIEHESPTKKSKSSVKKAHSSPALPVWIEIACACQGLRRTAAVSKEGGGNTAKIHCVDCANGVLSYANPG